MGTMLKRSLRFFYFLITIAILIVGLKIINWLPIALQGETMRRYNSIEEVKSRLNIKDIFIPTYFPQNLNWPPSEILAQTKPFTAIIMEFRSVDRRDTVMIIAQASSDTAFMTDKKIKILQIKERVSYPLKGRDAKLEVGLCKGNEPCSQISWIEGGYRMNVIMKSSPQELIRIVDSMIH